VLLDWFKANKWHNMGAPVMIVEEVMTHGIESIDDLDTLSDAAA
jgi:hypothetical protein